MICNMSRWHTVFGFRLPTWVFFFCYSPFILCNWVKCKLMHQNFDDKMDVYYIVNELRKVSADYGKMDSKGNWNVKTQYKLKGRCLSVRVRFRKSAGENLYDKFKQDIQNFTHNTSDYVYKRGWAYFDIVLSYEPITLYGADRSSVYVGTDLYSLYKWDFAKYPHALVTGDTGQGKSTWMYYLLNGLLSANIRVHMIDGKMIDYNTCNSVFDSYVGFNGHNIDDVVQLIYDFQKRMEDRQEIMKKRGIINYIQSDDLDAEFLIIDEYQSISGSLPKRDSKDSIGRETLNRVVQNLIRLGRAMGFIVVITMQRPDAEFIDTATRDNCKFKLVLGQPSNTGYTMMFERSDLKGFGVGKGWCMQGNDLVALSIPYYTAIDARLLSGRMHQVKSKNEGD